MRFLKPSELFVAQLVYLVAMACVPGFAQVTDKTTEIRVFSLVNASASDMAKVIDTVFGDEVAGLAMDKRTNSLIVRAPSNETLKVIDALLMKLDQSDNAAANQASMKKPGPTASSKPAANHVAVRSEVSAAIASLIEDGKRVKKGDLIVELDDAESLTEIQALQIEIEEFKAGELEVQAAAEVDQGSSAALLKMELQLAERRLEHAQAEAEFKSIVAEAETSVATQTIEILQKRKERLQKLFASGQASSDELDPLSVEAGKAKAAYEVASAKQKLLASKTRPMQIAAAELEIVRARLGLDFAKRSEVMRRKEAEARRAALRLQLDHKHRQLKRFEEKRAKCKIYAPADGVVRYAPLIAEGAHVRARQTVLLLEP